MSSVWKVGTRWGNCGESVFHLFLDYGIVFVGGTDDGRRQGDYNAVKAGDLFLIADGATPVAIGIAQGRFQKLKESRVILRNKDRKSFFNDATVVCKTEIKLLPNPENWAFDTQKRFCRNNASKDEVRSYWERIIADDNKGKFDIDSRTVTLFPCDIAKRDSVFNKNTRYRVPIYQRPYSWGEKEITRLFQDITRGISDGEPLFLGTMQLSEPALLNVQGSLKRYDIIDGQQRITTFLLMMYVLGKMNVHPGWEYDYTIRTLVNKGKAQEEVDELLNSSLETISHSDTSDNAYLRNACFIYTKFMEMTLSNDDSENSDDISPNAFKDFLENNIRLVVIETHAGLSKTIQIFNIINTTGLDLNGSDIFKVRLFEFLTTKRDAPQNIFDDISDLYAKILNNNNQHKCKISMSGILTILQTLLITRYEMNTTLYGYATDRFFEQLFDTLLNINAWKHFNKETLDKILIDNNSPLSIDGISKLIDCRFTFEQKFISDEGILSDVALNKLMWQSRYGWRHWYLPIIYQYQIGENGLMEFYNELVRYSLCYSMIYAKIVGRANTHIRNSLKQIFESPQKGIQFLRDGRIEVEKSTTNALNGELAWNPTWKNIVCRLSEYLEHTADFANSAPDIIKNLFHERIDIEHIQSFHDVDGKVFSDSHPEWKGKINQIGNLVMLESSTNRSISNKPFSDKKPKYIKSKFTLVKQLATKPTWNIEECDVRCQAEIAKLTNWLFNL